MMKRFHSNARVAEVNSVCMSVVSEFNAETELQKAPILPEIIAKMNEKNLILGKSLNNGKVASLAGPSDEQRDGIYRDIGTFLTGCAVVRDEEKKKKALLLKSIYEKYGRKTVSLNQQAETAAIRNMLSDFKAAEVEEAVKTFDGLSDLLEELEKAQDDFDKATSVYRDAKLNKGTSASELKAEIINIMNNELIGFLSSVYNNPTYSTFAKKVEDIVNKSNSLASQRNKKVKEPAAKETPASGE